MIEHSYWRNWGMRVPTDQEKIYTDRKDESFRYYDRTTRLHVKGKKLGVHLGVCHVYLDDKLYHITPSYKDAFSIFEKLKKLIIAEHVFPTIKQETKIWNSLEVKK